MESKQIIDKLKVWLVLNSSAKLAAELGYRHSTTIDQWVARGRIPGWQRNKVLEIIEREERNVATSENSKDDGDASV